MSFLFLPGVYEGIDTILGYRAYGCGSVDGHAGKAAGERSLGPGWWMIQPASQTGPHS